MHHFNIHSMNKGFYVNKITMNSYQRKTESWSYKYHNVYLLCGYGKEILCWVNPLYPIIFAVVCYNDAFLWFICASKAKTKSLYIKTALALQYCSEKQWKEHVFTLKGIIKTIIGSQYQIKMWWCWRWSACISDEYGASHVNTHLLE